MRTLSALLIATVVSCAAAAERIIYVNHAATGANDGSSWEDAFNDLHDALAAAAGAGGEDVQLWVAAGEYLPGPADEVTQAAFQLVSGVAMYGGFAGWETMVEQRDWLSNQTVLTVVFNETVLMGNDLEADSLLDGFFIVGAWSSKIDSGGGLALYDSTFAIANCEFRDNVSVYHGASIATFDSTLTVTATTFQSNWVPTDDGTAIYASNSSVEAINCLFFDNEGTPLLSDEDASLFVKDSLFLNNRGAVTHGGIAAFGNLHVSDCVFHDNYSEFPAISGKGQWLIENSEFINNSGAIQLGDQSDATQLTVLNSTFFGNDAQGSGGGIYVNGAESVEIDGCHFEGNFATSAGGAMSLQSVTQVVVRDTAILNNTAGFAAGGGILTGGSLTLINCEIRQNSGYPGGGVSAGTITMINSLVAENNSGVVVNDGSAAMIINSTLTNNNDFELDIRAASHADIFNSIIWETEELDSCAGACGGHSGNCWCDEDCCLRNDCCFDKLSICGGCEPNVTAVNVSHSIIKGLPPHDTGEDPMFIDPEAGNFRLQAGSKAIDAGDNSFVPKEVEFDLDGNPRIVDGDDDGFAIVDIGAYEHTGETPVPPDGDLNGDGIVNEQDLLLLLTAWGPCAPPPCAADLDGSSAVGVPDLLILLANWG